MRFVGGKISKNEGGVTVNTPAGALAIRGGMAMGKIDSPKDFAFIFLYGEYLALNGDVAFECPFGFFAKNGNLEKRPATPDEIRLMVASLSRNPSTAGNQDKGKPNNFHQLVSMKELIADATTERIIADANGSRNFLRRRGVQSAISAATATATATATAAAAAAAATAAAAAAAAAAATATAATATTATAAATAAAATAAATTATATAAAASAAATEGSPGSYDGGVFERQGGEQETGLLHDVMFNAESKSVSFGISEGEAALLTFNENGSPKSAVV